MMQEYGSLLVLALLPCSFCSRPNPETPPRQQLSLNRALQAVSLMPRFKHRVDATKTEPNEIPQYALRDSSLESVLKYRVEGGARVSRIEPVWQESCGQKVVVIIFCSP